MYASSNMHTQWILYDDVTRIPSRELEHEQAGVIECRKVESECLAQHPYQMS